jgi:hypothetical protein
MTDAVMAVTSAGGERHYPEPRPGFDARFSKGVALTTPDGFEIDLHRTLAGGVYGHLITAADLWADARELEIAGCRLTAPGPAGLATHACIHAVLGDPWPRLENLRDVAVALTHPTVHLDAVLGLARRWQVDTVVAYAIGAAWTELDLDPDLPAASWARAHRPDRRACRRLAPYLGRHRNHARQALGALGAIPGWSDRARYLRAIMLPDQARRTNAQRWRRGVAAFGGQRAR